MSNPNYRDLAGRDPAAAALLGALPGADFGAEFGDFGDDEFSADIVPVQAQQAWHERREHSHRRALLLDPNHGSSVKVEQYMFNLSQAITIGSPLAIMPDLNGTPDTVIKPTRMVTSAPMPGFVFITDIKASNVSASIGAGAVDAYVFNANSVGTGLHLPKLIPSTRVTVTGAYTGAIPPNVLGGTASYFTVSFFGPSTLAGG